MSEAELMLWKVVFVVGPLLILVMLGLSIRSLLELSDWKSRDRRRK